MKIINVLICWVSISCIQSLSVSFRAKPHSIEKGPPKSIAEGMLWEESEKEVFPNLEPTHISWVLIWILNVNIRFWQNIISWFKTSCSLREPAKVSWRSLVFIQNSLFEDSRVNEPGPDWFHFPRNLRGFENQTAEEWSWGCGEQERTLKKCIWGFADLKTFEN